MSNMIIPGTDPGVALQRAPSKTITFDGTASLGQAGGTVTVWTVTGRVLITHISTFCTDSLTEGGATATIKMGGASGNTALFRGTTNAVDIDVNEWWDAAGTGTTGATTDRVTTLGDGEWAVVNGNIAIFPLVQDVTGGSLVCEAMYIPLTDGASLA